MKDGLECMLAILPWLFNGSRKGCRPYLLRSGFARSGDIMIRNERTRGTRLYCRWCAVDVTNTSTQDVVVGRPNLNWSMSHRDDPLPAETLTTAGNQWVVCIGGLLGGDLDVLAR